MRAMAGMATDHGQWYLPYAVANEEQGIAMLQALRAELLRGNSFPNQLAVPDGLGARGRDMLYPTEPGIARFYITDMNNPAALADFESTVPVVISQPHAGDKSSDVLFLDGHLASVPLGVFPLSEDFLDALEALDPPAHQGKAPGTH